MNEFFKRLFGRYMQTRRTLFFPVPVDMAAEKLKNAFISPMHISGGFFSAGYSFSGEVKDTDVSVTFTVKSRASLDYQMFGKLFLHNKGSQMIMIVNDETPVLFLLMPILFSIGMVTEAGIFVALIASIFMFVFTFLMMGWHRLAATDKLSDVLNKIIAAKAGIYLPLAS